MTAAEDTKATVPAETPKLAPKTAERCRAIIEHERTFAREFASRAIDQPRLTPWMVVLPVMLIPYFIARGSAKKGVATCMEYHLRPRLAALEVATEPETRAEVADEPSEALRLAESGQIETLAEHYRRLLDAKGADYRALVLSSYRKAKAYRQYLDKLESAQIALDEALLVEAESDVGAQAATQMREASEKLMSVRRDMHREEVAWLFE